MEPEDSLSCLQEPIIKTYPEVENAVHILTTYLFRYVLILSSHLCLRL
jgi:hypothetical protein